MTDAELSDIYKFAIQLGKDAGKILLEGLDRRRSGPAEEMVEKMNAVDIVTQTDNGTLVSCVTPYYLLFTLTTPATPTYEPDKLKFGH